jgi:cell division septation protein DedD
MEQISVTAPPVVVPPPTAPQVVVAEPVVPPVEPQQPKPAPVPQATTTGMAKDPVPIITPQPGQRYIQVGALNENATRAFVQRLRSQKLEPQVAPGPKPELLRVLIGPFDNPDTLNERKAQLESEGIQTFVRKY